MNRIRAWVICLFLILSFLVGCNAAQTERAALPTAAQAQVEAQVTSTDTAEPPEPSPTVTDTPQPGLVMLLAPPGSDSELASRLVAALEPRVTELGLRWESRTLLASNDLSGMDIRLVVALSPDPGLASLAAAAPQTQFLAVGIPGIQAGSNLSLIGQEGLRLDRQGFIAGVIAAMITPDWRVGVVGPSEPGEALHARQGFINGAEFFCGLCLPYHGPTNINYPVFVELSAGAGFDEIQAALQNLNSMAVKTIYLPPGVLSAELMGVIQFWGKMWHNRPS
jgi:hypothetical protein